jgi:hypothetical protein
MIDKNRIMIYDPKDDGTYVVEFRMAEGDVLAISIPRTETHVIRHFQDTACSCRMFRRRRETTNNPGLGAVRTGRGCFDAARGCLRGEEDRHLAPMRASAAT